MDSKRVRERPERGIIIVFNEDFGVGRILTRLFVCSHSDGDNTDDYFMFKYIMVIFISPVIKTSNRLTNSTLLLIGTVQP